MDYEKHIQLIIDAAHKIQLGKITVLTGKNGSGKSVIRKQIATHVAKLRGMDSPAKQVAAYSMETRTQPNHAFSVLKSIMIDDPSNPTSDCTLYGIDSLAKSIDPEDPSTHRYLVIDEPEIGMGEEMIAALVIKLTKMFDPLPTGCLGLMIITHNRYIVQHLSSEFVNIEGMDREEWLNRVIIPTDIDKFKEESLGLYRALLNRSEDIKKEKTKA